MLTQTEFIFFRVQWLLHKQRISNSMTLPQGHVTHTCRLTHMKTHTLQWSSLLVGRDRPLAPSGGRKERQSSQEAGGTFGFVQRTTATSNSDKDQPVEYVNGMSGSD